MKPGSVLVDVAIDQGGTVETIDAPTSIDDPVFTKYDVIHYAVPNQPGAVPRTAQRWHWQLATSSIFWQSLSLELMPPSKMILRWLLASIFITAKLPTKALPNH